MSRSAGPTRRNAPLYGPPGYAYVYLNYGIHYLVNAVTEAEGSPAAVLIRALAPLDGIELMTRRRARADGRTDEAALCRGPGNLTQALGITLKQNRLDLTRTPLWIEDRGLSGGDDRVEPQDRHPGRRRASVAMLARRAPVGVGEEVRAKGDARMRVHRL